MGGMRSFVWKTWQVLNKGWKDRWMDDGYMGDGWIDDK